MNRRGQAMSVSAMQKDRSWIARSAALSPLTDDARFSIDVKIINNPDINAFAELGGRISLNRGLVTQSPEEVAGVLAQKSPM